VDKKKRIFVRPRIVRRREKLATIVQFATGSYPTDNGDEPEEEKDDDE